MKKNHRALDTYINNNNSNVVTLNSIRNRRENTKSTERRKTSVPKEYVGYVENIDSHKPVLSKIMTTQE